MSQQRYTLTRTLTFAQFDCRGVSRPSALFDLMQDTATVHAHTLGLGGDELSIAWALLRMAVEQTRPFYPGEALACETVFEGVKGPNWCRSFYFRDRTGAQVARASSTWAMLDAQTHGLLRPRERPACAHWVTPPADSFVPPKKLSHDALTPHHVHKVRYSDLDMNNHLNNVKIVDLIADGLELERRAGQFVSSLQVNYTAECRDGDALTLLTGRDAQDTHYIFGRADGADRFAAAARLSAYSPDRKDE